MSDNFVEEVFIPVMGYKKTEVPIDKNMNIDCFYSYEDAEDFLNHYHRKGSSRFDWKVVKYKRVVDTHGE